MKAPCTRRSWIGVPMLALLLAVPLTASAQTWPTEAEWIPGENQGVPVGDPCKDQPAAVNARDVVGDDVIPAFYVSRDADWMYFRIRLDDSPQQGVNQLQPFGWSVIFDTDGDYNDYEYVASANGIVNPSEVILAQNTIQGTIGSPNDVAEVDLWIGLWTQYGRITPAPSNFCGSPDYFIEFMIPVAPLYASGLSPATPIGFMFGTSSNARALNADVGGCTTGTCFIDPTDPICPDTDGDGIDDCDDNCIYVPNPLQADFNSDGEGDACDDSDDDGDLDDTDCAPLDPTVYHGAPDAICNGIDNDCDLSIDEDYVPMSTTCGLGVCASTGVTTCVGGVEGDTCEPGAPTGLDDDCNGIDEDCDGTADNWYVPLATTCGLGVCASEGATYCEGGMVYDTCAPGAPTGLDQDCNGIDENCDGTADDGYVPMSTTCGLGVCASTGVTTCVGGVEGDTCEPGSPTGLDDDCNGIDEDCDGTADNWYVPLATTCGLGVCASEGATYCEGGMVYDTCEPGAPTGLDQDCNGIDENCDGTADDGYVPMSTTCGLGVCASEGATYCEGGMVYDTCAPGAPTGLDQDCNGIDENCDGTADDGYVPLATECGLGVCASEGVTYCEGGMVYDTCAPGMPWSDVDTTCDGFDDDCNGTADDGYVPLATECGLGVCASEGVTYCEGGKVFDTCAPGMPWSDVDTTCDGYDDDCNGFADEDYVVLPTTCGVGACASEGATYCLGGEVFDTCLPDPPLSEVDTTCDGIDDDCDGTADDDYVPYATSCGVGACSATGTMTCVGGLEVDSCLPGDPGQSDDDCDGNDDNCDGTPDDGYVPQPTTCGVGYCASTGMTSCMQGMIYDSCMPGAPLDEIDATCDGIDDDCDGTADDDYLPVRTSCGTGYCASEGVTSCEAGMVYDSCAPGLPLSSDDATCDGVDDNCNESVDEDYVPVATNCGVGYCASEGVTSCDGGVVYDSCDPGAPLGETDATCDGIDDDCDGTADDDYVPYATYCGVGACASEGTMTCVDGQEIDSCVAGDPGQADDDCDGNDDNCDGTPDDGYVPQPTTCGVGACASEGVTSCMQGMIYDSCIPGDPLDEIDATCDGIDDDCDGTADDEYQPMATSCGVGSCASEGVTSCVDGEVLDSCEAGVPLADVDTTCDGVDDDCDGFADEDYVVLPTTCGVGACAAEGATYCYEGEVFDTCLPEAPLDEIDATCDGVDDDCDGTADDDYVPYPTYCGVGACAGEGMMTCVDGAEFDSCVAGDPGLADDDCDGIDDNCDGYADEGYEPTETFCGTGACGSTGWLVCGDDGVFDTCVPGDPLSEDDATCDGVDDNCSGVADEDYLSLPTTCGVGACASEGATYCEGGEVYDSCVSGTPAQTDNDCDGIDDNCDGYADDGYIPVTTTCGVGVCASTGLTSCMQGFIYDSCEAGEPTSSTDATCNGIDEDCSGAEDEDYVPYATSCGTGACLSEGTMTCVDGEEVDTCQAGEPAQTDDDCDGIDDDCNEVADDGYVPQQTQCGVGYCLRTGVTSCMEGQISDSCVAGQPLGETDATCDGVDDNCDGTEDEDYVPVATECGAGACVSTGMTSCVDGDIVDSCQAKTPAASDATCDGVDDDCNGDTDEDFVPYETECGTGACAATGTMTCVAGQEVDSCMPVEEETEVCDGIDNNCDGETDEGFPNLDGDAYADCVDCDIDGDDIPNENPGCETPENPDNCLLIYNPDQADYDRDGIGDACEDDFDGDGILDVDDNCWRVPNPQQENLDKDEFGDACDCDIDDDGILNENPDCEIPDGEKPDNCTYVPNADQMDLDKNKVGDACEEIDPRHTGGCSAGPQGGGEGWAVPLVLMALVGLLGVFRRRSFRGMAAGAVAGAVMLGSVAAHAAPEIPVQAFEPSPFKQDLFTTGKGYTLGQWNWDVGALLDYQNDPLVLRYGDEIVRHIVAHQFTAHVFGAVGFTNWFDLGLVLPVILFQGGEDSPGLKSPGTAGIGDIRFVPRFRLVRTANKVFALGITPEFTAPTGRLIDPYMGSASWTFSPWINMSLDWKRWGLALDLGYRLVKDSGFKDVNVDDQIRLKFGAWVGLVPQKLDLIVELIAATSIDSPFESNLTPVEPMGGLRWHATPCVDVNFGGGAAVTEGIAGPRFRLFAGVTYGCDRCGGDKDGDGFTDCEDSCKDEPEDVDGHQDKDGCPDVDNDLDKVCDPWVAERGLSAKYAGKCQASDQCPDQPGPLWNAGCPAPDPDKDKDLVCDPWVTEKKVQAEFASVCKGYDRCPDVPEDRDGNEDEDGCPEEEAKIEGPKIVTLEPVYFYYDKDEIIPRSFPTLEGVAQILRDNPQIVKVRIEAHTDTHGSDAYNIKLSLARAKAVLTWLTTSGGIAAERLESEGFGESRLLVSPEVTEEDAQKNRRVEFIIVEMLPQ